MMLRSHMGLGALLFFVCLSLCPSLSVMLSLLTLMSPSGWGYTQPHLPPLAALLE